MYAYVARVDHFHHDITVHVYVCITCLYLVQLLLREKVIPNAAVCRFRDLGIELDLSGDDLDLIEQNVQQNPVIPIATKMLEDWLQLKGGALVEDLSTAIHNVGLITYAVTLAKG